MTKTNFQLKHLHKILQRLKSLLLTPLSPTDRQTIQEQLQQLDENYTNNIINFDEYKINSVAVLCSLRHDLPWTEQFLYRETGNFFTQQEKFFICELSQKIAPLS